MLAGACCPVLSSLTVSAQYARQRGDMHPGDKQSGRDTPLHVRMPAEARSAIVPE
jgi:hypothetical protein